MNLTIRRADAADADAIADLYLRARKAAADAGTIPPHVHTDDEAREWIAHVVIPERETWIAESSPRTPIGLLVLDGEWIDQLYVDPGFTGRGIGTKLIDVARRESPEGLRLWTFVSNAGAQRFYERHGFVEARRTDGSGNEEGAPDIEYVRAPTGGRRTRPS